MNANLDQIALDTAKEIMAFMRGRAPAGGDTQLTARIQTAVLEAIAKSHGPAGQPDDPVDLVACTLPRINLTPRAKADLYAQVDASMGIVNAERGKRLDRRLHDAGHDPDRRAAPFDRRARVAGPKS